MGGRGVKRALPMVAREAVEWNLSHLDADEYLEKRKVLDAACQAIGRDPASIRSSVMVSYIIGRDRDELRQRALRMRDVIPSLKGLDADEVLTTVGKTELVGTPEQIVEQIRRHAALGIDLFMLQHFLLDDRDALKLLAAEVAPAIA